MMVTPRDRTARFYQADITRAIKAARSTGAREFRIEIAVDGTISIIVGDGVQPTARRNSCDDLLDDY